MGKIIAIDGPAGSGKGTVAKIIANKLNLVYIDTGATYRCVALAILENNIDYKDEESVVELARSLDIKFLKNGKTLLNGRWASEKLNFKVGANTLPEDTLSVTIGNMDAATLKVENLTSAESRIRDVDMASEMVTYTKNNILQQSAMAMLAQANQQPEQILTLLQG